MKKFWAICLVLVFAASSLAGCGAKKAASVNGTPILLEDVDKRSTTITENAGRPLTDVEKQLLSAERLKTTDKLIAYELTRQGAKSLGVKVDKKIVDKLYENNVKQFPGEGGLVKQLELKGLTKNDYMKELEAQVLVGQIKAKLVEGSKTPSDTELRAVYEKYKSSFMEPEQRRVRDLPFADDQTADQASEELATGATFASLVEKYSADPVTKSKQGDLGFFARGTYNPGFETPVFDMKKFGGNIIMTRVGEIQHMIQLIEWRDARQLTFEESRDRVIELDRFNKAQKAYSDWFKKFSDKAKIKKYIK